MNFKIMIDDGVKVSWTGWTTNSREEADRMVSRGLPDGDERTLFVEEEEEEEVRIAGLIWKPVSPSWWHGVDPECSGCTADKMGVVELLSMCIRSKQIAAVVRKLAKMPGVGPVTINRWLTEAGWERGFVRSKL